MIKGQFEIIMIINATITQIAVTFFAKYHTHTSHGLSELALLHTLANIPVDKCTLSIHQIKLVVQPAVMVQEKPRYLIKIKHSKTHYFRFNLLTKQTRCHVLFRLVEAQTVRPELIHIWRLSCFLFYTFMDYDNIKSEKSERLKSAFVNYLMSTAKRARADRGCCAERVGDENCDL